MPPLSPLLPPDTSVIGLPMFIDLSVFGPVNGARGRERILVPDEAAAVRQRQRRYQPPKPPAIHALLEKARQLQKRLETVS